MSQVQNLQPKLAFLGTGLMGVPMAQRLLEAGYPLTCWNRTAAKARPLEASGAVVAESPAEAVGQGEVVFLMLADAPAIQQVLFPHKRPLPLERKVVVQMGTITAEESRAVASKVVQQGGRYLEAPVLGSVPQARQGKLQVMAGGEETLFAELLDLLRCFGPAPRWVGPVGAAATLKLALNNIIAAQAAAFATSLALIQKAHVSLEVFLEILRQSAFYAPTFERKLPVMLDPSLPVNFPGKHMLKDVRLIRNTTESLGVNAALVTGLETLYAAAVEAGLGEADYAAVARAILIPPQEAGR